MTSRVGRVAVRLKLPATERTRADETRRTVEHVVIQQALDELERVVHERLGEAAIVHVHRLAFRWKLERAELDRPDAALAIGRELAAMILDELEAAPRPHRLRPVETANAVMFVDADHALAAALADAAEQRTAWFHARHLEPARDWAEIIAASPERAAAVTSWLARMDMTAPVAAWLAERAIARPVGSVEAGAVRVHAAARDDVLASSPPTDPGRPATEVMPEHASAVIEQPAEPAAVVVAATEPPASFVAPADARVRSEYAGVFYLARLVQQLDLGEHLWAIGVQEGDVLAHVAGAVVGSDLDDPAWRWFGGSFDRPPVLAPIAEWAVAELEQALAATLARALGRTSVVPRTELLSLAPLVTTDPRTADAVARCADALCQLWCARLAIPVELAAVRAALRLRGTLELAPDLVRVTLPMEAIDVAIRRAGLDLDPGHLPWLGRAVEIVYAGDGEM